MAKFTKSNKKVEIWNDKNPPDLCITTAENTSYIDMHKDIRLFDPNPRIIMYATSDHNDYVELAYDNADDFNRFSIGFEGYKKYFQLLEWTTDGLYSVMVGSQILHRLIQDDDRGDGNYNALCDWRLSNHQTQIMSANWNGSGWDWHTHKIMFDQVQDRSNVAAVHGGFVGDDIWAETNGSIDMKGGRIRNAAPAVEENDYITKAQSFTIIDQNTNLYVVPNPANGDINLSNYPNGDNTNDGSSWNNAYATPNAAIAYLANKIAANNITINIYLAPGVWKSTATAPNNAPSIISISNLDLSRCYIRGAEPNEVVFTNMQKVGNPAGWPTPGNTRLFYRFTIPAPTWIPSMTLSVGDLVHANGTIYECITAHTSSTGNAPPNATYWKVFAQDLDWLITYAHDANYCRDELAGDYNKRIPRGTVPAASDPYRWTAPFGAGMYEVAECGNNYITVQEKVYDGYGYSENDGSLQVGDYKRNSETTTHDGAQDFWTKAQLVTGTIGVLRTRFEVGNNSSEAQVQTSNPAIALYDSTVTQIQDIVAINNVYNRRPVHPTGGIVAHNSTVTFYRLCCYGYSRGIASNSGAVLDVHNCYASKGYSGFLCYNNGQATYKECVAKGNIIGYWISSGSSCLNYGCKSFMNLTGIGVDGLSSANGNYRYVNLIYFNDVGISVSNQSYMSVTGQVTGFGGEDPWGNPIKFWYFWGNNNDSNISPDRLWLQEGSSIGKVTGIAGQPDSWDTWQYDLEAADGSNPNRTYILAITA